jgi:hypothetical protein
MRLIRSSAHGLIPLVLAAALSACGSLPKTAPTQPPPVALSQ